MENEIKIMDGNAAITRCKNSNIWQMRMWISRENIIYAVINLHLEVIMKQAKVLNEKELKKVIDFIDATDRHAERNRTMLLLTH